MDKVSREVDEWVARQVAATPEVGDYEREIIVRVLAKPGQQQNRSVQLEQGAA